MEETLEDLCELSKQLGDESIHLKIQLLSKELIELRDFEEDEQNG